jgi:hypothetical protein
MSEEKMCACGKPLHYTNPVAQELVQDLIDRQGEYIRVTVNGRTWLVPRHFIALHGINAWDLETLGFPEFTG